VNRGASAVVEDWSMKSRRRGFGIYLFFVESRHTASAKSTPGTHTGGAQ